MTRANGRMGGLIGLHCLGVLVALGSGCARDDRPPRINLEHIASVRHKSLVEASALLESRKHVGVYWTLNDSGNGPQLFAIDRTGALRGEFQVKGAINIDWEALATDDAGSLYIGDVGNNGGVLKARWVYQVKEPDALPANPGQRPLPELAVVHTYSCSFPDRPFDCEAMVFHEGSLYLWSKVDSKPFLYRLPLDQPGKSVPLVVVCALPRELRVITDAALSADGKRLALLSYDFVATMELQPGEPLAKLEGKQPTIRRFKSMLVEGCGWDGEDLLLITEPGALHRLRIASPGEKQER